MAYDPLKIDSIKPRALENVNPRVPQSPAPRAGGPERPFNEFLEDAVTEVQRLQNEADTTIKKLVSGEIKDVSEALVEVQQADHAFQTMMAVRSRVLTAYDEIMRMQI